MTWTCTLTLAEFDVAIGAARLRLTTSLARGFNADTINQRSWLQRMNNEIVGACGELAFAKWSKRYFVPSLDSFHSVPDCFENVELRATHRPDGRLIVRDNDAGDRTYVLAIVRAPEVTLRGWIDGIDAMDDRYLADPGQLKSAWFVPQDALKPMEHFYGF